MQSDSDSERLYLIDAYNIPVSTSQVFPWPLFTRKVKVVLNSTTDLRGIMISSISVIYASYIFPFFCISFNYNSSLLIFLAVEYIDICPSGKGYIPVEGTLIFGQTSYTGISNSNKSNSHFKLKPNGRDGLYFRRKIVFIQVLISIIRFFPHRCHQM